MAHKLFYTKRGKKYFKDRIKTWIGRENNDLLISIIRHVDPKELVDSNGLSMLHIATKFNNGTIIQALINIGCEIDAKNPYGDSALTIAVTSEFGWAMGILINANADLFSMDLKGQYPLKIFLEKEWFNVDILQFIFKKMKNIYTNSREITEKFIEANCTLIHIIYLEDAEITKCFLAKKDKMGLENEENAILEAIKNYDAENVEVLLHRGDRRDERRVSFLRAFRDILCNYSEDLFDVVKYFIEIISNWKILNKKTVCSLGGILADIPENSLHLVLRSQIDFYVKNHFEYDLLLYVFGNTNPRVIDWIQSQPFHIHSTNTVRETALHVAVKYNVLDNIKYLLKKRINPNLKTEDGRTALFYMLYSQNNHFDVRDECAQLLLLNGADIQAEDDSGKTFIERCCDLHSDCLRIFAQYFPSILAHFAMLEVSRIPVNKSLKKYLSIIKKFNSYNIYGKQLETLKTYEFSRSLTLFEIIVTNIEQICRHISVSHYVSISEVVSTQECDQYYKSVIIKRVRKAVLIKKMRIEAITLIGDSIQILKPYYLVLDKIVSYMSDDLFHMFREYLLQYKQELREQ